MKMQELFWFNSKFFLDESIKAYIYRLWKEEILKNIHIYYILLI